MTSTPETSPAPLSGQHADEPHDTGAYQEKLNRLRAAVLGANDGIVSVAATCIGVAGATASTGAIGTAAAAALVGGSVSMALGEYVSVSSQVDSHHALIAKEEQELREIPEEEFEELVGLLRKEGLSEPTARQAAREMSEKDVLGTHLKYELGIDQEDIPSPWAAALSSAGAFLIGAILPVLTILLFPAAFRIPATFLAVLLALAITGTLGAKWGDSPRLGRAAVRVVVGGALAMGVTWALGHLLGASGAL